MTREERLVERCAIAREAVELEAAGSDWSARHVCAALNMARSTLHETPWLMRISRRVGKRGRRWVPREVRNQQAIVSALPATVVRRAI